MDTELRALERRQATGEDVRVELGQAWVRMGLGWHGQQLSNGVVASAKRDVYLLQEIELVYVPGWSARCSNCLGTGVSYVGSDGVCRVGSIEKAGSDCLEKFGSFYIGRYPVTWGQYLDFCEHSGHIWPPTLFRVFEDPERVKDTHGLHPVFCVSRDAALDFTSFIGARLPTGKEWDYAAKGSKRGVSRLVGTTEPVSVNGEPANPDGASWCGAQDMVGHVWQLDQDGTARGGSYKSNDPYWSYVFLESHMLAWYTRDDVGFRIAVNA